jgi:hypothetical protein
MVSCGAVSTLERIRNALDVWEPRLRTRELLVAGIVGTLLLGGLAAFLGVWEPWEAQRATVLEEMLRRGDLLHVPQVPVVAGKEASADVLPYGWWPALAAVKLLGFGELGLRLPGLLFAAAALLAVFAVTRRLYGRLAAWFALASALSMPLFTTHARHLLHGGPDMAVTALAALGLLWVATVPEASARVRWGAWLAVALSGLFAGATGLAIPLVTGLVAAFAARREGDDPLRRLLAPAPMVVALVLVGAGWAYAALNRPEGASLAGLLLWKSPLQAPDLHKSFPSFEQYIHQIGFGLFPIGALVPFAFAPMLWGEPDPDESAAARAADPAVAAWFAVAFLGPALAVPETYGALFLGAPAVAVAAGAYLARVVRRPAEPVLGIATVLVVFLLYNALKVDTHYIADTLVGARVDSFPPTLAGWKVAKSLSWGLMLLLLVYQLDVPRHLRAIVQAVAYPPHPLGWFQAWLVAPAALAAAAVWWTRSEWIDAAAQLKLFGPMLMPVRRFVVLLAIAAVGFVALRLFFAWRARELAGRREGVLTKEAEAIGAVLARPHAASLLLGCVLAGWALFDNVLLARSLTTNFSQRDLVERYGRLARGDEPLYKYGVDRDEVSFYTRRLAELNPADFKKNAAGNDRFFAIIPRPKLAQINDEFRQATGRTLPVLDADSFRFLLVSNQLRDGEEDENPIQHALVKELPANVQHKSDVRFEDQLQLAGWSFDPAEPRAGSKLTITLYWKVLKKIPYDWKVFMHIDTGGSRIHGDHDPVEGLYPTTRWAPGDIVRDEHHLDVGATSPAGKYTVWVGLYRGDTRMTVTSTDKDNENRARLGDVNVR